ncbi:hypothetical protein Pint_25925 [Pistacia integerrima]|uniref:Uncharacterized protein n=1 Tax=Pistacia integerrima TaxID=434235 RepID=A0ACC0YF81_9ROSI|nr:hypothetical protein Pint_25925 [Pistacia integerrima]
MMRTSKRGCGANQGILTRAFSVKSVDGDGDGSESKNEWEKAMGGSFGVISSDYLNWETSSMWSTGLTKEHFDDEAVGHQIRAENRKSKALVEGWGERIREMRVLLKQGYEAEGAYNSGLKELEEEEENRLGHPFDDSVELLFDTCQDCGAALWADVHCHGLWLVTSVGRSILLVIMVAMMDNDQNNILYAANGSNLGGNDRQFFISQYQEFHVASLPYKPDFKVMPKGWDGTIKDLDEVHYEISQKEDAMLCQEFVLKINFNKMKYAADRLYARLVSFVVPPGWQFTVEKMGPRGKCGGSGGWKFVSMPDGSSRPLNEMEKMYMKQETSCHHRRILT